MNSYKKRGLMSILTMVLVIGLLSTAALAVNTDGDHRSYSKDVDGQQIRGNDDKGNNRRANIKNSNGDGNNINISSHARTGRTGIKTIKVPTPTSVTAATTGSGNNRRANIKNIQGDGNNTSVAAATTGSGNNRRANIKNIQGDGNNNIRGEQARTGRGEAKLVKIQTSTNITAALTGSSVKP